MLGPLSTGACVEGHTKKNQLDESWDQKLPQNRTHLCGQLWISLQPGINPAATMAPEESPQRHWGDWGTLWYSRNTLYEAEIGKSNRTFYYCKLSQYFLCQVNDECNKTMNVLVSLHRQFLYFQFTFCFKCTITSELLSHCCPIWLLFDHTDQRYFILYPKAFKLIVSTTIFARQKQL